MKIQLFLILFILVICSSFLFFNANFSDLNAVSCDDYIMGHDSRSSLLSYGGVDRMNDGNLNVEGDDFINSEQSIQTIKAQINKGVAHLNSSVITNYKGAVTNGTVNLHGVNAVNVMDGLSLKDAVKNSNNGDIILIPEMHDSINNVINVDHNLTIKGDNLINLNFNSPDGLFIVANNSTLILENVKLNNIYLHLYNSVILNKGNLILKNCLFYNSHVSNDNGIIYSGKYSNVTIEYCEFINNSVNIVGAAVCNDQAKNVNIKSTLFQSNTAYSGGAVYNRLYDNGQLTINDSTFRYNNASKGGAVYNKDSRFTMVNNHFYDNCAVTGDYRQGGAIFNENSDDFGFTNCEFMDNNALQGGAVYTTTAVLSVGQSNFTNNNAGSGGAIYNKDGKKKIYAYKNTKFTNNGNSEGGYGGAITINNGGLKVSRSEFNDNIASYGGAVYINSNNEGISLDDCKFNNNHPKTNTMIYSKGGAIYNNNANIQIIGTIFNSNCAEIGGAIYSAAGLLKIYGEDDSLSIFNNNSALERGGAIYSGSENDLNIDWVKFENNSANNDGGALSLYGGNKSITNSTFNNNRAAKKGGGLFITHCQHAFISNVSFKDSYASNGGAVYSDDSNHVLFNKTVFTNNHAGDNLGSAIFHDNGLNLTLMDCTVNLKSPVINDVDICGGNSLYYGVRQIHII